ncbi:MAG: CHASE2 domain-containing protein [Marinobacter sp.]|uniref:CHASE2 domain-containing protein n=1 Tax=Marinobacter sp. TaxID=50741 RepID=UPI0034A03DE3
MGKRILFRKILRRHWLVLVLGYFLVFVDPFGISTSTSKAISHAFDRMVSPFYSANLAAEGSDSADLVDVILIDDFSIRMLSDEENGYLAANDWPLAYSDHGVIIDALRRRGYGTVILDTTFYRARSTDHSFDSLVTRLTHFRDSVGMNVILSAGEDPDELEPSIHPLVEAASNVGLTGWSGHGDHYPLEKVLPDGDRVLTLAVAGYRAYCQRTGWSGCEDLSKAEEALLVPKPEGMHLNWGMPATRMGPSVNCQPPKPDSTFRKLMYILQKNVSGPETVDHESLQTCPPVPTATLSDVFCSLRECDSFFENSEPLGERIAMVGVSLPSARDLFDPPTPGRLPGVYLHAEALRNLLLHGADYFKPIGLSLNLGFIGLPGWSVALGLLVAWPILLIGVVGGVRLILNWRWERNSPSQASQWSELAVELVEIVIVLFLLGLIYSVTLACHRTPGPLADLIGLTPLLLIAIRKERKEMENERISSLGWFARAYEQPTLGRNSVYRKLPRS